MTEFTEAVEKRRMMIEAEEWAKETVFLQVHKLKSMWYDTRPEDTDDSFVMDVQYNTGRVERTILKTGEKVYFGEELKGDSLLNAYLCK